MANRKKEVYKPKPMTEGKQAFIHFEVNLYTLLKNIYQKVLIY